ncbi:MAG: serine/threonine-protein kinase [Polyangiaceae bacterium]
MTPNETEDVPGERASTLEEAKTDVGGQTSNRPVTVVGEGLRFSPRPAGANAFNAQEFVDRYAKFSSLGEGGMGEVRLCNDARIGRDVAMKVIRLDHHARADYRARFLREVRIQGQLEHPSIVPVYDLGIGADGATYFTMKRVRGLTLADILDRLRVKDPTTIAQYSQRKLVTAFQSVCLALAFAHSRGVIHRDLKPTNIMLGDFGEVYVLDWGIAKIKSEPTDVAANEVASHLVDSGEHLETQVGSFVGTLGYLSPEQISGEEVDGRSDIYGLGALLFEILTLGSLHRGSPLKIAQATAEQVDARCSSRYPDREVAPELEEICVKATMLEPKDRYASARDLHDAIGRYLDGDRDLERRKMLAANHLEVAEAEMALIAKEGGAPPQHRAKALGELGRALALDPGNEAALGAIVNLLLKPPRIIPREVLADMQRSREETQRAIGRIGFIGFPIASLMMVPVFVGRSVTNWTTIAQTVVCVVVMTALCWVQQRNPSHRISYWIMSAATLAFLALGRVYGPLMLIPQLAMCMAFVYSVHPVRRVQIASVTLMTLTMAVPLLLERIGLWHSSYLFRDGEMVVVPNTCKFTDLTTTGFLGVATIFLLLVGTTSVGRIRNALTAAEERLSLQAWQLRQLVPERARRSFRE